MLSKVVTFRKKFTCPSAEMLCAYRDGKATSTQTLWIERHLTTCDFCGAEFRLLSRYSPADEPYEPVEIPPHIRCLAESLLHPRHFPPGLWLELTVFKEPSMSDV